MYDLETIDAYIRGNLAQKDKEKFERSLASDEALLNQVNERKEFILIEQLVGATAKKQELKELYAEAVAEQKESEGKHNQSSKDNKETSEDSTPKEVEPKKGKLRQLLPYLLAAACLTALCYFFIFKIDPGLNNLNSNPLIAEYYAPYSVAVRSNDTPTVKDQAYQLYSNKKYKEAIPFLRQISTENEEARLLEGIALLETGSTENALKRFEGLSSSLLFSDHAKWYAALTHLQLNQPTKAKELLQTLTNQTEYSAKATELLKKLM